MHQCHHHDHEHSPPVVNITDNPPEIKESNTEQNGDLNSTFDIEITDRKRIDVSLDSIKELKQELKQDVDKDLTTVIKDSSFVGIVDESKRLCCFQYDVQLFLCDYASILNQFYYQMALINFCNYGELEIDEPVSLSTLLDPLYEETNDLNSKEETIQNILNMKEMYQEYFQISITQHNGEYYLNTLPMILRGIQPVMDKIPFFLYRLGNAVNYEAEKECLQGIMQQIALLYIPEIIDPSSNQELEPPDIDNETTLNKRDKINGLLENFIFPQLRQKFLVTKNLSDSIIQIADLPGLYKIFERC